MLGIIWKYHNLQVLKKAENLKIIKRAKLQNNKASKESQKSKNSCLNFRLKSKGPQSLWRLGISFEVDLQKRVQKFTKQPKTLGSLTEYRANLLLEVATELSLSILNLGGTKI